MRLSSDFMVRRTEFQDPCRHATVRHSGCVNHVEGAVRADAVPSGNLQLPVVFEIVYAH